MSRAIVSRVDINSWAQRNPLGVMLIFAALAAFGWGFIASLGGDDFGSCEDAIKARVVGANIAESTISWEDQGDTKVARGQVDGGGERFSFECGVTDGELVWLDVS